MRRITSLTTLTLALTLLVPIAASAKDICVQSSLGETVIFRKVKRLKKPGQVSPLHGIYINGSAVAPISGTAVVRGNGSVMIAYFSHSMLTGVVNFTSTLIGTRDFTATGEFDNDGDYSSQGISFSISPVSCKGISIP